MPRPKSTLVERIQERTFRADRHADLLLSDELPKRPPRGIDSAAWDALRAHQVAYRVTEVEAYREQLVRAFGRIIRQLDVVPAGSLKAFLFTGLGPSWSLAQEHGLSHEECEQLYQLWSLWDGLFGLDWRLARARDQLSPDDKRELLRRITGAEPDERRLDKLDEALDELQDGYTPREAPWPPGWWMIAGWQPRTLEEEKDALAGWLDRADPEIVERLKAKNRARDLERRYREAGDVLPVHPNLIGHEEACRRLRVLEPGVATLFGLPYWKDDRIGDHPGDSEQAQRAFVRALADEQGVDHEYADAIVDVYRQIAAAPKAGVVQARAEQLHTDIRQAADDGMHDRQLKSFAREATARHGLPWVGVGDDALQLAIARRDRHGGG